MFGPRALFRGFFCFFCFPRVFLVFWSGSFYRLLGPPKTKKPRGKPKKTKRQKQTKKTKDSQECLGQGLCSEALFFFLFSSSFFGFWLRKLLSATRTTNNLKTSRKTKKTEKNAVFSGMSGPLSSDAVVFYLFFLFFFVLWFACFCFWVMVAAPPPENKPILLQTLSPINLSSIIGFFLCSMLRVAVAKKSTNQGHEG